MNRQNIVLDFDATVVIGKARTLYDSAKTAAFGSYVRSMKAIGSFCTTLLLMLTPAMLGFIVLGVNGVSVFFIVGMIALTTLPEIPPELVLKSYRAQPLSSDHYPELNASVAKLADAANLARCPVLYLLPSADMLAFSLGTEKNSAIALSEGLLQLLDPRELTSVIAHEMGHIKNHDTQTMLVANIAQIITEEIAFLGKLLFIFALPLLILQGKLLSGISLFLFIIFSPVLSALIRSHLSRRREFEADSFSARLTEQPWYLASALRKVNYFQRGVFSGILSFRKNPLENWMSTHPETHLRIERLNQIFKSGHNHRQFR